MAAKIKKGDRVILLTGKDKGRTGAVTKVLPKDERVFVSGLNLVGLRRRGVSREGIAELKEAFRAVISVQRRVANDLSWNR